MQQWVEQDIDREVNAVVHLYGLIEPQPLRV
jgi:hypothetical protein